MMANLYHSVPWKRFKNYSCSADARHLNSLRKNLTSRSYDTWRAKAEVPDVETLCTNWNNGKTALANGGSSNGFFLFCCSSGKNTEGCFFSPIYFDVFAIYFDLCYFDEPTMPSKQENIPYYAESFNGAVMLLLQKNICKKFYE